MQRFTAIDDLVARMKADLFNRTFPDFLRTVADAVQQGVGDAVKDAGARLQDAHLPTPEAHVTRLPPRASVLLVAEGTAAQANAYEKAFADYYRTNLEDRPKFLRLVREAGLK